MRTRVVALSFLFFVVVALGACRTAPINNPTDQPVPPNLTQAQVGEAIKRGATGLGWVVQEVGPGEMLATQRARRMMAEVAITYTATSYNIQYRSSENLRAEGDTIHKRYNGWIKNLQARIQAQLAAAGG